MCLNVFVPHKVSRIIIIALQNLCNIYFIMVIWLVPIKNSTKFIIRVSRNILLHIRHVHVLFSIQLI
jgi:hypothetical protein